MRTSARLACPLFLFAIVLAGCTTKDVYDIRPQDGNDGVPSAVAWQNANDASLVAATKPQELAAFIKTSAAADALLAEVKGAYATDPMTATRVAAVTQLVMCPACDKASACRELWSAALLRAAETSSDATRTMFFLDQLRWCGTSGQKSAVLALGAKAKETCVKDFATWVARELK